MTKVQFSKEAIDTIAAALPSSSNPARSALLPKILRAWAEEDLHEHLSREGGAALRQKEKRLRSVGRQAQNLIEAIHKLDQAGFFETAFEPQRRHAGTSLYRTDVAAGKQRRDSAISWLKDLAEIFNGSEDDREKREEPERPPDRATRHYLIISDLAAIYELVSEEKATRRVNPDSEEYGPFTDFVASVWDAIFENSRRGPSYAIRVWAD